MVIRVLQISCNHAQPIACSYDPGRKKIRHPRGKPDPTRDAATTQRVTQQPLTLYIYTTNDQMSS